MGAAVAINALIHPSVLPIQRRLLSIVTQTVYSSDMQTSTLKQGQLQIFVAVLDLRLFCPVKIES